MCRHAFLLANLRIARRSSHLGQTGCCICHKLLRGLFRLLMGTLLGHAGCTLSGQHLMKHRSTGVILKRSPKCEDKPAPLLASGLPMSTKRQTVYFLCRSMMVDRRFQEFRLALLGINLFEHLGQATMECLSAGAVSSQSVGDHDRSLNFS